MSSHDIEDQSNSRGCCERNKWTLCLVVPLLVATICLAAVIVADFGLHGFDKQQVESKETSDPKPALELISAVTEIENTIDQSVDPCKDFHGFVCGNFLKTAYTNEIGSPRSANAKKLRRQIDAFIVNPPSPNDLRPIRMQKKYFQSCLNESAMDLDNSATFFKLTDKIGGWPLLDTGLWLENKYNWIKAMVTARKFGLPFEWLLSVQLHQVDKYELKIGYPQHSFDINYVDQGDYMKVMANITKYLTHVIKFKEVIEIEDIYEFEKELAEICEGATNKSDTLGRIEDLENIWFNEMQCLEFINSITGQTNRWRLDSKVMYNIYYIKRLKGLLDKTPKRVQANYMMWTIIKFFSPYLSRQIREARNTYLKHFFEESVNRFEFCLENTKQKFPFVSETAQVRISSKQIQDEEKQLVRRITYEARKYVQDTKWKSTRAQREAANFLQQIKPVVGGTQEMFEDTIFDKYLHVGRVHFNSDNIIDMLAEWSINTFSSKMELIGEPVPRPAIEWAYVANAENIILVDPNDKQMFVPAAAFHSLFYNSHWPQYLNYAGLGTDIAASLAETLFTSDSRNLKETHAAASEILECIAESIATSDNRSYNDFSEDFKTNAVQRIGEIIAYRAYQRWLQENEEEPELLWLDYNPNQLFWIKSGSNWCHRIMPDDVDDLDNLEREEGIRVRLLEGVKTSEFFAEDFNCPHASSMTPVKKCGML